MDISGRCFWSALRWRLSLLDDLLIDLFRSESLRASRQHARLEAQSDSPLNGSTCLRGVRTRRTEIGETVSLVTFEVDNLDGFEIFEIFEIFELPDRLLERSVLSRSAALKKPET